jgi:hypothetical protein
MGVRERVRGGGSESMVGGGVAAGAGPFGDARSGEVTASV